MQESVDLEAKVVEYLDKAEGGLKAILDVSSEQVPIVIQEYLNWHMVSSIIGAVVAFAAVGALWYAAKWCYSMIHKTDNPAELGVILCISFSILPLIIGTVELFTAIKIWIAPRVFLIDKFGEWISG